MIIINNLTKTAVSEVFLKRIAKIVLKGEKEAREEISIIFVGRKRIKSLNKKYRNKNESTDVLAFGAVPSFPAVWDPATRDMFHVSNSELGEVVVCPEVVKKNAIKFKKSFKKELAFVLIHGILHLIGYKHEKGGKAADLMQNKEIYYASKV